MESFYVISKQGNGPFYTKGDYTELLYEVNMPCSKPCKESCMVCLEGRRGKIIDSGMLAVVIGDGQLHEFIDNVLLNKKIRHGSAVRFYLCSNDAFEDIGADTRVPPNSALCFRIEEISFSSCPNDSKKEINRGEK